jgi:tetraacyldisaccharide 4'-kinase
VSGSSAARRVLLPLVPAYRLALGLRELRLRSGLEPVRRLRWPVVSVGSLSAGGAGKTPMTIALAKALACVGFQVDVLSRGYGRNSSEPARVLPEGTADEFGDEPLLIARATGMPVYVAADRYQAGFMAEAGSERPRETGKGRASGAKAPREEGDSMYGLKPVPFTEPSLLASVDSNLSASTEPSLPASTDSSRSASYEGGRGTAPGEAHSLRIHLLDDGFQHRQLHRDIDILLVSPADWRDHLLPAGNLREPRKAARRASVIAIPADEADFERELKAWGWQGPIWRLCRCMEVPKIDCPVAAFCGIARPEQFFRGLEGAGLRIVSRTAFPDHHRYTAREIERVVAAARAGGAAALISTDKDRVRLGAQTAAFPSSLPLLTASLRIEIEDDAIQWLERRLSDLATENLRLRG